MDTSDLDAVRKALKPNTCAVYLETPANPNLKIADISAVAALAHGYNKDIKVIVRQHLRFPVPPAAAGAGRRRGGALRHQVPERPRRRDRGLCGGLRRIHAMRYVCSA